MRPRVYIDGKEGTTGLQIYERLGSRSDLELLTIDEEKRKDPAERKKLMDAADLVFLCLPDAAAIEAVGLANNPATRIIDTSTAHRTAPGWVYGYPELGGAQRKAIAGARRVANPGCHATGLISSVAPLVRRGILAPDSPLCCYSLTGYSGGGKKLIAEYEAPDRDPRHRSHRIYGLALKHKHLPEMMQVCGLTRAPIFSPILGDFYKGMATTVLLYRDLLARPLSGREVRDALAEFYAGEPCVSVAPYGGDEPVLYASDMAGSDALKLEVAGNDDQISVTALFDNLGKGASGAAVQNMNLMLGFAETTGLAVAKKEKSI